MLRFAKGSAADNRDKFFEAVANLPEIRMVSSLAASTPIFCSSRICFYLTQKATEEWLTRAREKRCGSAQIDAGRTLLFPRLTRQGNSLDTRVLFRTGGWIMSSCGRFWYRRFERNGYCSANSEIRSLFVLTEPIKLVKIVRSLEASAKDSLVTNRRPPADQDSGSGWPTNVLESSEFHGVSGPK